MDVVKVVEHNGASILLFDFTATSSQAEALDRIEKANGAASKFAEGTALILTQVAGAYLDEKVIKALFALAAANRPYVKASAVVGANQQMDEVRQLVAGMTNRVLEPFEDLDAAMSWLAEQ